MKLNKRERKAAQLLVHYATCERLGKYLGMKDPDGKKISVALWKIEREANQGATAYCNGEPYGAFEFHEDSDKAWDAFKLVIEKRVAAVFDGATPPGLFVNADARGYALKIEGEDVAGCELLQAVKLHTDWGGYGILSPEITGD